MRIKSYFAESIRTAMADARRELGADALLLKSNRVSDTDAAHRFEVVFGILDEERAQPDGAGPSGSRTAVQPPVPQRPPKPVEAPAAPEALLARPSAFADRTAATPGAQNFRPILQMADPATQPVQALAPGQLSELRRQISEIQALLADPGERHSPFQGHQGELEKWACHLLEHDFELTVVRGILKSASERLKANPRFPHISSTEAGQAVRREIESAFTSVDLTGPMRESRTVVTVGPPGAGKTLALTNLAIEYGLSANRQVFFVGFDPHRPTGSEKLEKFAAILDVPYSYQSTAAGIQDFLRTAPRESLVFMDVPGYSLSQPDLAAETSALIETIEGAAVHLVLPASMKARDLLRYANFYSRFHPQTVIVTRTDETKELGGIVSACRMLNIPISLASSGQDAPGSLNAVSVASILENIFGPARRAASVA